MSEATVPINTTCCPACRCGGGCRFAQAAANNAHDPLVEALEDLLHQVRSLRSEESQSIDTCQARAALEEAKS